MDVRILHEHGRPYTMPRAIRRFPATAFEPYGMRPEQVEAMEKRLLSWAEEIGAGK